MRVGDVRIDLESVITVASLEAPGHLAHIANTWLQNGGATGSLGLCRVHISLLIDILLILVEFHLGLTTE